MLTLEVTILIDDDLDAEDVNRSIGTAVEKAKDAQGERYGFEWFEVNTTSERLWALEELDGK